MIISYLKPDWEPNSCLASIEINKLINKDIKALILDVDGTILSGKDIKVHSPTLNWIKEAKKSMKIELLSNNPSEKRISKISNILGLNYTHRAVKPRRKKINQVIKKMNVNPNNIAMVGDRIFTDIIGGNRLGLYTILVKPVGIDGKPLKRNKFQNLEKLIAKFIGAY
tara:strand:+ start:1403 stop:1906 length:504 start_codon:yes stop_codon:yes gene_type:complete